MKARITELAIEAMMVVFAVLVALGVEEWRSERELQGFASRVEATVLAEIRVNHDEMARTGPLLVQSRDRLAVVVEAEDLALLQDAVNLELPDISLAAWTAAQTSQAGPWLDYDWLIEVARVYEGFDTYEELRNGTIEALGVLVGTGPALPELRMLYGRLAMLVDVHQQLEVRLRELGAR